MTPADRLTLRLLANIATHLAAASAVANNRLGLTEKASATYGAAVADTAALTAEVAALLAPPAVA